jgi:hypothetical protein
MGARVIDGTGKYLIPGLWDLHAHRTDDAGVVLPLLVANGVAGVRDMGNDLARVRQRQNEIRAGRLTGPRIVAAGPIVDGPRPLWPGSVAVGTEREARGAVTDLRARGADFVKVYESIPRAAYFALADEARKQGLPFAGHVPVSVTAAEACEAGQKSIEHLIGVMEGCSPEEKRFGREMAEALAASNREEAIPALFYRHSRRLLDTYDSRRAQRLFTRFARKRTRHVPTLVALRAVTFPTDASMVPLNRRRYLRPWERAALLNPDADWRLKGRTPADSNALRAVYQKQLQIVGAMHRAGVPLMAGSDTGSLPALLPGFSLHDELELLVRAGLTPAAALRAATLEPARFLGEERKWGTIQPGRRADLILLTADPLRDIRNTTRIDAVVLGGRFLERTTLDQMLAAAASGTLLAPIGDDEPR